MVFVYIYIYVYICVYVAVHLCFVPGAPGAARRQGGCASSGRGQAAHLQSFSQQHTEGSVENFQTSVGHEALLTPLVKDCAELPTRSRLATLEIAPCNRLSLRKLPARLRIKRTELFTVVSDSQLGTGCLLFMPVSLSQILCSGGADRSHAT